MMPRSSLCPYLVPLALIAACPLFAQDSDATPELAESQSKQEVKAQAQAPDKRIFGVLPNYRTVEGTGGVEPLTVRRKFWIASKDSFDYPIYFLSGAFAGISQIENSNPSFGQGLKGYAKRYAAGYGDQMIGNMMTEDVFPSLLHEDLRYLRLGVGGTWKRARYPLTPILVTHTF
jgi:hypothetical protein